MQRNRPQRILIVDDDLCIRHLSSSALIAEGYRVDTAENGEEGWHALSNAVKSGHESYDLLITDNSMPKLSGVDLIRKVRSASMELPVILASGTMPLHAESLGLAAILSKPFFPSALVQIVQEILQPDLSRIFPHRDPLPTPI
jgi:two-component system cell cycle sensor histidine kinase/response regulator CckA